MLFSNVSSSSVDSSWTKVRPLAFEIPDTADDSEMEDFRERLLNMDPVETGEHQKENSK